MKKEQKKQLVKSLAQIATVLTAGSVVTEVINEARPDDQSAIETAAWQVGAILVWGAVVSLTISQTNALVDAWYYEPAKVPAELEATK